MLLQWWIPSFPFWQNGGDSLCSELAHPTHTADPQDLSGSVAQEGAGWFTHVAADGGSDYVYGVTTNAKHGSQSRFSALSQNQYKTAHFPFSSHQKMCSGISCFFQSEQNEAGSRLVRMLYLLLGLSYRERQRWVNSPQIWPKPPKTPTGPESSTTGPQQQLVPLASGGEYRRRYVLSGCQVAVFAEIWRCGGLHRHNVLYR